MNDRALDRDARRSDVMAALLKHGDDAITHCDTLRRALRSASNKPHEVIPVELLSQALTAEIEAAPWRELRRLGFSSTTQWDDFARMLPEATARAQRQPAPPNRAADLVYTAEAVCRSLTMNRFLGLTEEANDLIEEEA